MKKVRYALIGCGRISPNHIAAVTNHADKAELIAICDVAKENAEELLKKFNLQDKGILVYTEYQKMLEDLHPDLVAIATESGKHASIAIDCIESGCNLIVEKPIALSLADADAMIAAAEKKGVFICACHQNRFNKSIQQIRKAVEQGRFGRLFHGTAHIRWNRGEDYYKQAPWRGTWEQDGGALMNQCIHNIDLLRWMMGDEIEEVQAYTDRLNHPYIDAEDLGIAIVRFKNGGYGIIEGTTNIYPKNLEETLYLFGEKGTVKAGGKSVNLIEEWLFADETGNPEEIKEKYSEKPTNVYGFGHTPLYENVLNAVISGQQPYIDGQAGRRALELVLAVYKSAAEGKAVKLPLEQCSTLDFKGRFR